MAKRGFADRKRSGRVWMLVKLQRPPPEIRIFSPGAAAWSRTSTWRPRLPASIAAIMPAAPAPMMTTSKWATAPGGFNAEKPTALVEAPDSAHGELRGAEGRCRGAAAECADAEILRPYGILAPQCIFDTAADSERALRLQHAQAGRAIDHQ